MPTVRSVSGGRTQRCHKVKEHCRKLPRSSSSASNCVKEGGARGKTVKSHYRPRKACEERSASRLTAGGRGMLGRSKARAARSATASARASPSPPPRRPASKTLLSAQTKIRRAVRRNGYCSDFSIRQRPGTSTCFMAASTLLFARAALKYCKVPDIRRYIRLTMSEWRQEGDQNACPVVPKIVRQHYADVHASFRWAEGTIGRFDVHDLECAKQQDCEEKALTGGGVTQFFLTALFFASDMSFECRAFKCAFAQPIRQNLTLTSPWPLSGMTLLDASKKVASSFVHHAFHLLDIIFPFAHESGKLTTSIAKLRNVGTFVDEFTAWGLQNGWRVEGVLVSLRRSSSGHAMSLFPCFRAHKTYPEWMICNSWGEPCTPDTFASFMYDIAIKNKYTLLSSVTFLLSRMR